MPLYAHPIVETLYTFKEGLSYEALDDYKGVCTVTYIDDFGATISGMRGEYKKKDFMDIFEHIYKRGVEYAYVRRKPGRKLAWGRVLHRGGHTDGKWYEICLVDVLKNGK